MFVSHSSQGALEAATEPLFQTSLPYSSAPALGTNLLVDVKDDCCTRPDNGLEILKCSYVTEESARDCANPSHCCCHTHRPPEEDHQPPPNKPAPAVPFTPQGRVHLHNRA